MGWFSVTSVQPDEPEAPDEPLLLSALLPLLLAALPLLLAALPTLLPAALPLLLAALPTLLLAALPLLLAALPTLLLAALPTLLLAALPLLLAAVFPLLLAFASLALPPDELVEVAVLDALLELLLAVPDGCSVRSPVQAARPSQPRTPHATSERFIMMLPLSPQSGSTDTAGSTLPATAAVRRPAS